MHVIRKTVVLAFAGFGLYKAGELANAQLASFRKGAAKAKARIEPALHDTEDTVQAAAEDVKASIHELSHTVAESVSDAATDAPPADAPRPNAPLSSTLKTG